MGVHNGAHVRTTDYVGGVLMDTVVDNLVGHWVNCRECGKLLYETGEVDEFRLCHVCYCSVMDTSGWGQPSWFDMTIQFPNSKGEQK